MQDSIKQKKEWVNSKTNYLKLSLDEQKQKGWKKWREHMELTENRQENQCTHYRNLRRRQSLQWAKITATVLQPGQQSETPSQKKKFLNFKKLNYRSKKHKVIEIHIYTKISSTTVFFSFLDRFSLCCPGWSTVAWSWFTVTSFSWVQAILLP